MVNPTTVIFATSSVNNNGIKDGFKSLRKDNQELRSFVEAYQPQPNVGGRVQDVMLLDFESLTDALIIANAEVMGIPANMAFKHVLTGRGLSEAHSCAGTKKPSHPEEIATCEEDKRGRISPNGMHWCDTTTGPRTAGGIYCLIDCTAEQDKRKKECQDRCNRLWMGLDTVLGRVRPKEDQVTTQ